MLTSAMIKEAALAAGADLCGCQDSGKRRVQGLCNRSGSGGNSKNDKSVVVRIKDSYNTPAIIIYFTKL